MVRVWVTLEEVPFEVGPRPALFEVMVGQAPFEVRQQVVPAILEAARHTLPHNHLEGAKECVVGVLSSSGKMAHHMVPARA